jgi:hypothetical protein
VTQTRGLDTDQKFTRAGLGEFEVAHPDRSGLGVRAVEADVLEDGAADLHDLQPVRLPE